MGMPQKLWISMQGYLFPLLTTTLVALGWQFYLHPNHILRTKNTAEGMAIFVRLLLWSVFITPKFGLLQSAGLYLMYNWLASNYIFINFAVSHTHLPVVDKEDKQVDWVSEYYVFFCEFYFCVFLCILFMLFYTIYLYHHYTLLFHTTQKQYQYMLPFIHSNQSQYTCNT